jgi:hypothetical protein
MATMCQVLAFAAHYFTISLSSSSTYANILLKKHSQLNLVFPLHHVGSNGVFSTFFFFSGFKLILSKGVFLFLRNFMFKIKFKEISYQNFMMKTHKDKNTNS